MQTNLVKHRVSESDYYLVPRFCPPWLSAAVTENVAAALAEDCVSKDRSTLAAERQPDATATIVSNTMAIIAGRFWVAEVFKQLQADTAVEWHVDDGYLADEKQPICTIKGRYDILLSGERCALNFLQTLSGTATTTSYYVAQLGDNDKTVITDTRKTIPGLRWAQKYAVVCGGGINHRYHLGDGILLKDNHIALYGSIAQAVAAARERYPQKTVEIEVKTMAELHQAVAAKADIIMLDNFAVDDIGEAVAAIAGKAKIEVSGDLGMGDIQTIASYGVDYISIGALTKHLCAIDMSMTIQKCSEP